MLDEEVILRTSRNSGETATMAAAIAAICVPAFLFGGESDIGLGALIALGILAPINIANSAANWPTVRNGAVLKFVFALVPSFIAIVIASIGICHSVLEWSGGSGREVAKLVYKPGWPIVSAALDPIYPITSELASLSATACALALYFVATSKYVLRKVLVWGAGAAVVLALAGLGLKYSGGSGSNGFGANGFSLFPSIAEWSAFAIIWQGGALTAAVYSPQRFKLNSLLYSLRFWSLAGSLVLWASVMVSGAPIEIAVSSVLQAVGLSVLAADVFPSKSNLKNYRVSRLGGFNIRAKVPFAIYIAAGAVFLWAAAAGIIGCASKGTLSFDQSSKNAPTMAQIATLKADTQSAKDARPMFGWGETSFTTIFAFYQSSELGYTAWKSPESDLQRALVETGKAGLFLNVITPIVFAVVWICRRKISLASFVMGVSVIGIIVLGCVRTPFESAAVISSFSILLYTFFGWDSSAG